MGRRLYFSKYPHGFKILWNDCDEGTDEINYENESLHKVIPVWDETEWMYLLRWKDIEDKEYGDKVYGFSANFAFGPTKCLMKAPYDPYLYFLGEEISLGIRLYMQGVTIVAPPINAIWTNYDRDNGRRGGFHWTDNSMWGLRDKAARIRLNKLFSGEDLGVYGLQDHMEKYRELQKEIGLDFESKDCVKPIYKN